MRAWYLFVLFVCFGTTASAQATSGRELYLSACAACHGADGRGLPVTALGFDTPVPDFTDCSFATPEADPDTTTGPHLIPGDQLVMVNGVFVRDLSTKDLRALLRGEPGTEVDVTVLRGSEVLRMKLKRTPLKSTLMPAKKEERVDEQ